MCKEWFTALIYLQRRRPSTSLRVTRLACLGMEAEQLAHYDIDFYFALFILIANFALISFVPETDQLRVVISEIGYFW